MAKTDQAEAVQTKTDQARPSLRDFDPYTDRNGQDMGQDSPLDLGVPPRTRADMDHDPMGQARDARVASDFNRRDAIGATDGSQATEDETPPENLRRISDPSTGGPAAQDPAAKEAITRQEGGGRDEAELKREWSSAGTPGRPPVSVGGSSGGHSDQVAAQGPREGEKVADGEYRTEKTRGKTDW